MPGSQEKYAPDAYFIGGSPYITPMRYGPHILEEILRRTDLVRRAGERVVLGVLIVGLCAASARADDHPTYQNLFEPVSQNKDCTSQDDVDLLIYTCDKLGELWYFTKPGHPAHPGVVRRHVVQDANGVSVAEDGWSFAPDAAQPFFKTFLSQIRALDEQVKDSLSAQHGNSQAAKPPIRVYGNWQPRGTENDAIISLTNYYFALEDGGKYEDAYALLDPGLTAMLPFVEYKGLAAHTNSSVGRLKKRVIKTIDWEQDSPLGPPGIYAALDYSADAEKGQVCGYVAWRKAADGFFTLVREETNTIPAAVSAEETASLKAKFHCVT